MRSHLKKPSDPTVKAVYCLDASSISTCQKPDLKLKLENMRDPSKLSNVSVSWICGRGVAVFLGSHIQLPKVYAKAEATILFPNQDNRVAPGAATGSNSPCLQHIIHVCPDLLQQWWWDASKSLLKGLIIGHLNVVLDLTGTP